MAADYPNDFACGALTCRVSPTPCCAHITYILYESYIMYFSASSVDIKRSVFACNL